MFKRMFAYLALSAWMAVYASPAYAVGKSYTGSWYNPAQNGHGFNFEMLEDGSMLVFWYVYRPDGTSTFLLGVAQETNGMYTATLQITEGMTFGDFNPADNVQTDWGTITITFMDCNHGTVEWITSAPGYSNGSTPITRLTSVDGANCNNSPFVGTYKLEMFDNEGELGIGRALLLPDGQLVYGIQFGIAAEVGRGTWQATDDSQGAYSATGYSLLEPPSPFVGSMSLEPDGISGSTNTETEFTGAALPSFQDNIALPSTSIVYTVRNGLNDSDVGQVTISPQGGITGTVLTCNIEGQMSIPDPNFNQFTVTADYDSCGNGTLQGAGTMNDDTLNAFLVDETEGAGYLFIFEPN